MLYVGGKKNSSRDCIFAIGNEEKDVYFACLSFVVLMVVLFSCDLLMGGRSAYYLFEYRQLWEGEGEGLICGKAPKAQQRPNTLCV